jgi:type III restriction enzyme
MDAIECGIVKLPRVPVADNLPTGDMPVYRDLWKHVGKGMPKKGRGKGQVHDPLRLPGKLQTALEALYGHYQKTFELWREERISVPPVFIVVCQNTAISKLIYDFISGFEREQGDGDEGSTFVPGRLELFRNHDDYHQPLPRPRTSSSTASSWSRARPWTRSSGSSPRSRSSSSSESALNASVPRRPRRSPIRTSCARS